MKPNKVVKMEQLHNLPISFEANQGQTDEQVKFLIRGTGYKAFFTPTEVVLTLEKEKEDTLKMKLEGAHPDTVIVGEGLLEGKVNYLKGNNPEKWVTEVALYEKIRYQEIYPGIDVIYYGAGQQLEHDFLVKPHADPSRICLRFEGAEKVEIDEQGNLYLKTATDELRLLKPKSYQATNGTEQEIETNYEIKNTGEVGFRIDVYDVSQTLKIDPVLAYSTYLGGNGHDTGYKIVIDSVGNAYVIGRTSSSDFPTTDDAFNRASNGGTGDVFITKINASGTGLIYSTYLGGSDDDTGYAIAIDETGDAYVTGYTKSNDFPTTEGAYNRSNNGYSNVFVTKLNSHGGVIYSTYLGGTNNDMGIGIAVDGAGNAYVTGYTTSNDFPTTEGAYDRSFNGNLNVFVTKLNASGTGLIYSTYLGGSGDNTGRGIAIDGEGNAYVTGWTTSNDFPTTEGAYNRSWNEGYDVFVTKLNASGAGLIYSTYLGGSGYDEGDGIAIDGEGNVYVTGMTTSNDFPTTEGAYDRSWNGGYDVFVTKLNTSGTGLIYSTYLGGSSTDEGHGIAIDHAGNVYVTGVTWSNNFPTTEDAYDRFLNGASDVFVTKLNASGTGLVYSTYLGGSGTDEGNGIAIDGVGNVYVTGTAGSPDFPTTEGAYDRSLNGCHDAVIVKFNLSSEEAIVVTPGMELPVVVGQPKPSNETAQRVEFSVGTEDFGILIKLNLAIQVIIDGELQVLYFSQIVDADGTPKLFEVILPIGAEIILAIATFEVI